jgi:hypothetical protein
MQDISRWQIVAVALVMAVIALLILYGLPSPYADSQDAHLAAFLQRHWQLPIAPQGPAPKSYTPLEASLHPSQCGVCHPQQYRDWQSTIHSRSMGPGVYGQLLDMEQSDQATYTLCATCHTPLAEQIPFVESAGTYQPYAAFDPALQQAGLTCAGCHVRQHQRFGPPRRLDLPPIPPGATLPHGGFTASEAYARSEFCQPCHQFGPDDFALNGKLLENTYEEWRQSRYAAEGTQCQSCHMPDRRHVWRGIHDADMVRQAMTVAITPHAPSYVPGDRMQTDIVITNSGAGHYFPTYVTPKIFVQAYLLDAQGQVIDGTAQQSVIGREVELDLSREVYDTRIPPGASHTVTYAQELPRDAVALRVRMVVHPDHFYRKFFAAILQNGGGGKGRPQLQEALRHAEASPFTVFERDMALKIATD